MAIMLTSCNSGFNNSQFKDYKNLKFIEGGEYSELIEIYPDAKPIIQATAGLKIRFSDRSIAYCSGVILPDKIVTAAHCLVSNKSVITDITIYDTANNSYSLYNIPPLYDEFSISGLEEYKKHIDSEMKYEFDIAMIKIKQLQVIEKLNSFALSDVNLNQQNLLESWNKKSTDSTKSFNLYPPINSMLFSIGWGSKRRFNWVQETNLFNNLINEQTIDLHYRDISLPITKDNYSYFKIEHSSTMLPEYGDSGSGLFWCPQTVITEKCILLGVISSKNSDGDPFVVATPL